jgi:hypothetical protein
MENIKKNVILSAGGVVFIKKNEGNWVIDSRQFLFILKAQK